MSLPKNVDPLSVTLEECLSIIEAAEKKVAVNAVIAEFKDSDIQILNGRYGPYIKHSGSNYKINKGVDASALTEEDCKNIIANFQPTDKKRTRSWTKTSKK